MSTTTTALLLTKPSINDLIGDTIPALADNFDILDAIYPVGIRVEFETSLNPNTQWPGMTWVQRTGEYSYAADGTHALGTTFGAATHAHVLGADVSTVANVPGDYVVSKQSTSVVASSLPPSRAVNVWVRTA